jgi:type IV pilus assembly protein PilF
MLNNYAVFLCSHERADEGVRYFEQAATNPLYRTPWAAYTNAGVCLRAAHRDADAAQRFARALRSNPAYSEAVFQASDLDFQQQKLADARFRIDVFMLTNPATPDLLLLAYRIAQVQKDATAQQRYAIRLSKEFPNSDQAHALAASKIDPG